MNETENYVPYVIVQNMVFTYYVGTYLNLRYINKKLIHWGSQYNPKKFAAVIIRWKYPRKIAILIFKSGKIVCTGSKEPNEAIYILKSITEKLKMIGYRRYITIQDTYNKNLVTSSFLPFLIDLEKLNSENSAHCSYDPETFPGAILKHTSISPITLLIFHSGKIIITAASSQHKAQAALIHIYPLLYRYKTLDKKTNSDIKQKLKFKNTLTTQNSLIKPIKKKKYSNSDKLPPIQPVKIIKKENKRIDEDETRDISDIFQ